MLIEKQLNTTTMISVIVPVFNCQEFINKCLDSILNNTYKNLEIILVDDGSTDNSPQICDEYANIDKRIKVIHKENGGLSSARNMGLDICMGEYISFIDSDDYVSDNFFESIMNTLNRTKTDIWMCRVALVYPNFDLKKVDECIKQEIINKDIALSNILSNNWGGQACFKIYKRYCFENVRFPLNRLYEDLAISHLPFYYCESNISQANDAIYYYRQNPHSISYSVNNKKDFDLFLGFKDKYEFAIQYGYKLESEALLLHCVSFGLGCFVKNANKTWRDIIVNFMKHERERIIVLKMPKSLRIRVKIFYLSRQLLIMTCKPIYVFFKKN